MVKICQSVYTVYRFAWNIPGCNTSSYLVQNKHLQLVISQFVLILLTNVKVLLLKTDCCLLHHGHWAFFNNCTCIKQSVKTSAARSLTGKESEDVGNNDSVCCD